MDVPSPWIALVLMLASYRIWRLLAEDMVLEPARRWLVRLPQDWEEGDPWPESYRLKLAKFIMCPWCFGWWIVLAIWALWLLSHHWTAVFCMPWALSAGVGFVRAKLDPPE
jgi:hypothetical protein